MEFENKKQIVDKKRIKIILRDIKKKSLNLPIIESDTENVIKFNSSFSEEIKKNKTRNFWNLLEIK